MTQDHYIIARKLNIVELSAKLGSISQACRYLGVSRQHYYDIKSAIDEEGLDGLLEKGRRAPRIGNRVLTHIETALLEYSLEFPAHGQMRVANELSKRGIKISSGGVRSVWMRHGLQKRAMRLKRLEAWAKDNVGILTERQLEALEAVKDDKQAHGEIETHHPGFVVGQDTFYVGHFKGIGKVYQQTAIDVFSNVGFAKLYGTKTAITSADMLNDKVLPFFDAHGIRVLNVLTDNGSEYCGRAVEHPYQVFLQLADIGHQRTRVCRPQSNGSTERLNQTLLDEFYSVHFRKKIYASIDELQSDLDDFMRKYNEERTNQGKRCQGRTPYETFKAALGLYRQYVQDGLEAGQLMN